MIAVVTLSKVFFPEHFSAGQETQFKAKLLTGRKIHTCRCNYEYWKAKIARLQEKGGILSIRQWSDKPYRSPQEVIKDIPAEIVGVQKLELSREKQVTDLLSNPPIKRIEYTYSANVEGRPVKIEDLAYNDGLTEEEYKAWFNPVFNAKEKKYPALAAASTKTILDFAIIQFTEGRYPSRRSWKDLTSERRKEIMAMADSFFIPPHVVADMYEAGQIE